MGCEINVGLALFKFLGSLLLMLIGYQLTQIEVYGPRWVCHIDTLLKGIGLLFISIPIIQLFIFVVL